MRKLFIFISIFLLSAFVVPKEWQSYKDMFEVDLDEELPSYDELVAKYDNKTSVYDRKYEFHFTIGNVFDEVFRSTIKVYGSSEKRLKHAAEDDLNRMLDYLSPEHYQYVGPYLHSTHGIPESILNRPGIKETKNQIPTRIAPEMANFEGLDFLSPHLYFLLMPEVWPSFQGSGLEYPKAKKKVKVKVDYNQDFFDKISQLVPEDNYVPNGSGKPSLKSQLRTINPTKDSPLTQKDAEAFMNTFSTVRSWGEEPTTMISIHSAGALLDAWDKDNGRDLPVQSLVMLVNPCKRLVQKIQVAGLEQEFYSLISQEGFNPKTWGYTCEKTVRAYRVASMPRSMVSSVVKFKQGIFEGLEYAKDEDAKNLYATMLAIVELYDAPIEDVVEVLPIKEALGDAFLKADDMLIDTPLSVLR